MKPANHSILVVKPLSCTTVLSEQLGISPPNSAPTTMCGGASRVVGSWSVKTTNNTTSNGNPGSNQYTSSVQAVRSWSEGEDGRGTPGERLSRTVYCTRREYDAERSPGEISTTYYPLPALTRPKVCIMVSNPRIELGFPRLVGHYHVSAGLW